MKRIACLTVALVACALLGARTLITQDAALVSGALRDLKFETVEKPSGVIGGPVHLKVTKKTLAHLEKLMNEGQTIEVGNSGAIKLVDPRTAK